MSQLNIDTIQNRSGGPVTLTQQSAAKAHTQINQNDSHSLLGSLNFSSSTDVGVGLTDLFFVNNFSATSYANPATSDGGGSTQTVVCSWYNAGNAYRTTSANSIGVRNINDNSLSDRTYVVLIYCGDLA